MSPEISGDAEISDDPDWKEKKRQFEECFRELTQREAYIQQVISKLPWKLIPSAALNIAISAWASSTGLSYAN